MPLYYLLTIYIDGGGKVAFSTSSTNGKVHTNSTVTLKRNDYLRFRIGNNQSALPTGTITINPTKEIPFASGSREWRWGPADGDHPATPECVLCDAKYGDYPCGLAVTLADGAVKLSEFTIKIEK